MSLLGGVELKAQSPAAAPEGEKPAKPPVKCAVIGLGPWGRDIVSTLMRLKDSELIAVCDTYPASLRRATTLAPKAQGVDDYRKILENKEVAAVIIATPSHQHRQIAVEALQAGKHVYCEAPLATTIEDARAIALEAKKSPKLVFQPGLQLRSDPQRHFVLGFIRAGGMGKQIMARAQWHKKQSWRFSSPNPEREQEINWRLQNKTSLGLVGEIGIHQIDAASWFFGARPTAVTGFGSIQHWHDGREVADTIQSIFEYPGKVNLMFHATLANSFDTEYDIYYGTDSAIMLRGSKAWMFKEADAPLLGWEVYAKKDVFYKETGIALVANATKLNPQQAQQENAEEARFVGTALSAALEAFLTNAREIGAAVEDFAANFDASDTKALVEYLGTIARQPAAGYQEGYEATVLAIKANEAIQKGQKIVLPKDWFELA